MYRYPICEIYDDEYQCRDGFSCEDNLYVCPIDMFMESLLRIDTRLYGEVMRRMKENKEGFARATEDIMRRAIPHETGRKILREFITGRRDKEG